MACSHDLSFWEREVGGGGGRQVDPGAPWLASLPKMAICSSSERPCLKNLGDEMIGNNILTSTSDFSGARLDEGSIV